MAGAAGVTLEVGVALGVVVLLANPLPPNPTAKSNVAAPPNSAIAVFLCAFIIKLSDLGDVVLATPNNAMPIPPGGRDLGPTRIGQPGL